jgi:sulfite reductase (NADPH) flavoprotein alpha-component
MARTATQPALTDTVSELPAAGDPWNSAPFDRALSQETLALVARLSPAQRLWLSGYLAGSLAREMQGSLEGLQAAPASIPTTILFGSESGNAKALARQLAQRFAARGAPHRVLDMLECRKSDLEQAGQLVAIVSTHGDGDPPERAVPFFELLSGRRAPRLSQTRFAVLALGDSSYEQYCAAGRRLDARLEELGALRALPRVECDVDFASSSSGWMESVLGGFAAPDGEAPRIQTSSGAASAPAAPAVAQVWTRRNPFAAEILANHPLTARGSTKDVRHMELSIQGSGILYEPGDALGIVPRNPSAEVDVLLARLAFSPEAPVEAAQRETSLREALMERFEIAVLSPGFVRRYAEATGDAGLAGLAGESAALRDWLYGRDLRDLIAEHPPRNLDARAFAQLLSPLAPRLYSVASSLRAAPDEVHLTIGVVSHESHGRARRGVVSGAVAGKEEGATLPVYLHRNEGFRLPADPATPIVMIGAGTGVAPYRGFLAEREAAGAPGRNWLFFGDRSFELDFLYQAEWLAWRRSGLLTRLDVAFSRDQPSKVYVQHRLQEQGAGLWRWLQEGAHLYVCGDASRMAPDVEQALLEVTRTHGGLDEQAAQEYLKQLRRERRYQKDVY